ncbi:hypothetical protein BC940DRAFT_342716 [Gongronella butleri]|nr:hypothetical protein BC940DRAFT_342716 [Gongronella butleri]
MPVRCPECAGWPCQQQADESYACTKCGALFEAAHTQEWTIETPPTAIEIASPAAHSGQATSTTLPTKQKKRKVYELTRTYKEVIRRLSAALSISHEDQVYAEQLVELYVQTCSDYNVRRTYARWCLEVTVCALFLISLRLRSEDLKSVCHRTQADYKVCLHVMQVMKKVSKGHATVPLRSLRHELHSLMETVYPKLRTTTQWLRLKPCAGCPSVQRQKLAKEEPILLPSDRLGTIHRRTHALLEISDAHGFVDGRRLKQLTMAMLVMATVAEIMRTQLSHPADVHASVLWEPLGALADVPGNEIHTRWAEMMEFLADVAKPLPWINAQNLIFNIDDVIDLYNHTLKSPPSASASPASTSTTPASASASPSPSIPHVACPPSALASIASRLQPKAKLKKTKKAAIAIGRPSRDISPASAVDTTKNTTKDTASPFDPSSLYPSREATPEQFDLLLKDRASSSPKESVTIAAPPPPPSMLFPPAFARQEQHRQRRAQQFARIDAYEAQWRHGHAPPPPLEGDDALVHRLLTAGSCDRDTLASMTDTALIAAAYALDNPLATRKHLTPLDLDRELDENDLSTLEEQAYLE